MNTNPPAPDPDDIRALHSALVSKRTTLDQLLWQAPVIALTAQAFLLTIAFDTEKCEFYRQASGIVATVIGLISWQLFLRHDALEKHASKALEQMERQYFKITVHERPVLGASSSFVARCRPRPIWARCLFLVSLAGLMPLFERFFN
jgi:hypothetical protein